jgi:outer membrane protein insertion porin family
MVKRLLKIGLLVVLASAVLQTAPLRAESNAKPSGKISDIIIQGNQRMSTEQIRSKLQTHIGDEYRPAKIEEAVRQLEVHHISIAITMAEADGPGRVKIYFIVHELGEKIQKVTFRGAKHLKEEELCKLTGIHPGMPLDPFKNHAVCSHIMVKYMEMGRPRTRCRLVKGGDLKDTEVIFDITEGPKVKVKAIQFVGNTFVSSARLATRINSSHEWFGPTGGIYNKQMADADVAKLLEYYRSFGFLEAKIALEKQHSSDDRELTLIFHIQEGQRYKVKETPQVNGPKTLPVEHLQALSQIRPGDFVDQNKVKADVERITNWYGGQRVQVQNQFVFLPDSPGTVAVNYQVKERTISRVGQIFVTGNDKISTDSILAHVPLFPGQVLSYPDLKEAEKRLAELDLFVVDPATGVHPTITVIDPDGDGVYKDIRIMEQEKPKTKPKNRKPR